MEKNVKKENRTIRQISVSALALILSAVLLFGAVVGGTLAWLMRKSETLTNTFILGNITSFTLFDDNANASNDYKASLPLYVDNKIARRAIARVRVKRSAFSNKEKQRGERKENA